MDSPSHRRRRINSFARRNRAYSHHNNGFQHTLHKDTSFPYDLHGDVPDRFDQDDCRNNSQLLVYGNPLWSEDHSPSLSKEGLGPNVENGDRNEAFCGQISVSSPQNGYSSYSTESSDGEDKEAYHGNGTFLNSRLDRDGDDYALDGKSTSSHSGSIYDMDSSIESTKDFIDREMIQESENTKAIDTIDNTNKDPDSIIESNNFPGKAMTLENHNLKAIHPNRNLDLSIESEDFLEEVVMLDRHYTKSIEGDKCFSSIAKRFSHEERTPQKHISKAFNCNHQRNIGESKTDNDPWAAKCPEVVSKENEGTDQNQQDKSEQESDLSWEHPFGLKVGDGRHEIKNIRNSMLWSSFEGYKKDLSTLSEQDEDFLYRNSEMLAAFEVEDHCNLRKNVKESFNVRGIEEPHEDHYEVPLHESELKKNETCIPSNFIKHPCQENRLEGQDHKTMKTVSEFDDTSSWITNDSEIVDPEQPYGATLESFHSLNIINEMPRNHVYRAEQENPTYDDTTVSLHRVDHNDLKTRKQKVIAMENEIKEPKTMMNVKAMEEELHKLQIENERLEKLLKEKELKTSDFSKERALWEQKKLSEMSIFNAFKEEETQRLRKERIRLEKQTKLLAQLPTKKERNEIEELQKKIANIRSDCAKKESLQNLTINRHRRTIAALTEQIQSLQDEVKRYEIFLQAEWGADSRKMINFQSISKTDTIQRTPTTVEQDDVEVTRKIQNGSRVTTTMYWTRPQQ